MTKEPLYFKHPLPAQHNIPRHFTASAVVIANRHILLVHHRRIGAWLPPGGHIEDDEMPHQAAERETFEETGIAVEAVSPRLPDTKDCDAFFLPAPLCMHSVKAVEKEVAYYHIDLAFICQLLDFAAGSKLPIINHSDEIHGARWFGLGELDSVPLAKNVLAVVSLAIQEPCQ